MKTKVGTVGVLAYSALVAAALVPITSTVALAQDAALSPGGNPCTCGSHPPKPRPQRTITPYANEPKDLQPYSKFAEPYDHHYVQTNVYSGAARDVPDPTSKTSTRFASAF